VAAFASNTNSCETRATRLRQRLLGTKPLAFVFLFDETLTNRSNYNDLKERSRPRRPSLFTRSHQHRTASTTHGDNFRPHGARQATEIVTAAAETGTR
jgi:hypothetical protein